MCFVEVEKFDLNPDFNKCTVSTGGNVYSRKGPANPSWDSKLSAFESFREFSDVQNSNILIIFFVSLAANKIQPFLLGNFFLAKIFGPEIAE
jgi:hypothetical protein